MFNITIQPLPTFDSFVHGYYGLESTYIRGMIIINPPNQSFYHISSLVISFIGRMECKYIDEDEPWISDTTKQRTLVYESVTLLKELEIVESKLEIPFEFPLDVPDVYDQELGSAPSPSCHLCPPSYTSSVESASGKVFYELVLESTFPSYLGMIGMSRKWSTSVQVPLNVYDPKLVPLLLHPEIRRWRSAPGAAPIEYDIEVGNVVLGPNDPLIFGYRLHVNPTSCKKGVRIKRVVFNLRQHMSLGQVVYTRKNFSHSIHSAHGQDVENGVMEPVEKTLQKRFKSKPKTLLKWEQSEYIVESTVGNYELTELCHSIGSQSESSKSESISNSRPGTRGVTGDGIYAEDRIELQIPQEYIPSTFKYDMHPTSTFKLWTCKSGVMLEPLIEIKHSVQVIVEFHNHERIIMESGILLGSVGAKECCLVLDEIPDIVPALDYDLVMGSDVWVPMYSERDSYTC